MVYIEGSKLNMSILTTEILWDFDLRQNTKSVERITDVNGAAADTQNNFGLFMLYVNSLNI